MFTVDEIRERLSGRNLAEVASRANLHYNVVYRVAAGITVNPSQKTIRALSDYLSEAAPEVVS